MNGNESFIIKQIGEVPIVLHLIHLVSILIHGCNCMVFLCLLA